MRQLIRVIEGSRFEGKAAEGEAQVFFFRRGGERFAVAWTPRGAIEYEFEERPRRIVGRNGDERAAGSTKIRLEGSPQYVYFG
jgi:hypothetical protein